jgi:hypothetical protein
MTSTVRPSNQLQTYTPILTFDYHVDRESLCGRLDYAMDGSEDHLECSINKIPAPPSPHLQVRLLGPRH